MSIWRKVITKKQRDFSDELKKILSAYHVSVDGIQDFIRDIEGK